MSGAPDSTVAFFCSELSQKMWPVNSCSPVAEVVVWSALRVMPGRRGCWGWLGRRVRERSRMERRGLAGSEELWQEGPSKVVASRRRRQSGVGFIGREWTLVFWRGMGWVQGECGGRIGILAETRGAEKRRVIE